MLGIWHVSVIGERSHSKAGKDSMPRTCGAFLFLALGPDPALKLRLDAFAVAVKKNLGSFLSGFFIV